MTAIVVLAENSRAQVTRSVPVSGGKYLAFVDQADFDLVMQSGPWYLRRGRTGILYAIRDTRKYESPYFMHMLLTGFRVTDHKNGNGLDNCRSNLRDGSNGRNKMNTRPYGTHAKGVMLRSNGKWQAYITFDGHRIHIGTFDTEEQAAKAYDVKAKELFGDYAHLNFP